MTSFDDDNERSGKNTGYGNGPQLERGLGARDVRRRADDLPEREGGSRERLDAEPGGWRRSDDRIRNDVNVALARDPGIDAGDIEVRVEDGNVTLTGTVADKFARQTAEDVAERVLGVTDVQNLLRVKRAGDGMEASRGRRGDREMKLRAEREGGPEPPPPSGIRRKRMPPDSPETLVD